MAEEKLGRFEIRAPDWLETAWLVVRHPISYRDHLSPVVFDRACGLWLRLDKEEAAMFVILSDLLEQHYWHGENGLAYARRQSLGALFRELFRRWRGHNDPAAGPIETDLAARSLDELALAVFDKRHGRVGKWNWFSQMSEDEWHAWLGAVAAHSHGRGKGGAS